MSHPTDEEMSGYYNSTHPIPGVASSLLAPFPPHQQLPSAVPVPLVPPTTPVTEKVGRGRGRRGRGAAAANYPNTPTTPFSTTFPANGESSSTGATGSAATGRTGVVIKTKFPVARIKRIMQADEDVGKVAQVTPVVVSKALELFMVSLCDKAALQARMRNSKRITAGHLKEAVLHEDQFDFLAEIIAKVPDIPLPSENQGGAGSGSGGDAEESVGGGGDATPSVKKTRKPRQRKVKDEDAFH
ncbi:histone-fold-containing protein [Tuber brumale]|nr:histone-fold-containing protein [Tuber brumale]